MTQLEANSLHCGYDKRDVLRDLTLAARPGQVLALAGPNGAGKTTLVRALARALRPRHGAVLVDGRDVWSLSAQAFARQMGLVAQSESLDWPLTVEQVVSLGRSAHRGWFMPLTSADREAGERALMLTGLTALRERVVTTLSGGEQQRVLIARALAQEPRILLCDEPTAHLDLHYQGAVLDLIWKLAHQDGLAVVMSLHDLNLIAMFADRVALLAEGHLVAVDTPEAVFTSDTLERAYGVSLNIARHPVYQIPLVTPALTIERQNGNGHHNDK
jgi:iron complex transport system ATP-binding protein